jgi:hypothetical protein
VLQIVKDDLDSGACPGLDPGFIRVKTFTEPSFSD